MNHVAIIYWSGTGNTEKMTTCIADGVKAAGGDATLLSPSDFSSSLLTQYDVFAFGCPSMGAEQLEESEFEPMFAALEHTLTGKKVALFGSYGWGGGQWMQDWYARCEATGANLIQKEGLIINETPQERILAANWAIN